MRKTKELLRLRFEFWLGQHQIARSCGMGLGRVHDYLERAAAAGVGWPLPEGWSEEELEAKLFGNQPVQSKPVRQRPQPDWKSIHEQLQQHRHPTLHQFVGDVYKAWNPASYEANEFVIDGTADKQYKPRPRTPKSARQTAESPAKSLFLWRIQLSPLIRMF